MIKIAIVGTGIIVNDHLLAIQKNDEVKLTAVCDINAEAAKKYGDEYNVPYYTDYKQMTKSEEIDAVILNLPHFLHCEVSVYFLERGINVLCEKPMANTVEECDIMLDAAEKSGAKLAIGHVQRFFDSNEIVKQYVDNKTLGELCMTNEVRNVFYFNERRPKWFLKKELSGGGVLMNFGAHTLDKLLYITGGDFTDIRGTIGNLIENYDVEGHAQVMLTCGSKVNSFISFCGYDSFSEYVTTYTFTKGALRVLGSNKILIYDKQEAKFKELSFESEKQPFEKQLCEFIKYIKGENANIADGEYSKKIIKAISEVYNCNN